MNNDSSLKTPITKLKVVLLAGYGIGSRKILETNKCFMEIDGVPLFIYVLRTLLSIENLDRIVVVGATHKVMPFLDRHIPLWPESQKVFCVNQGETIFKSITNGIRFFFPFSLVRTGTSFNIDPILFLPGDIPLLGRTEVEAFLEKANKNEADYCVGIVSEKSIEKFCQQRAFKEFKPLCYPFKEGFYRINNLHLLKVFIPGKSLLIDSVYKLRFLSNPVTLLPVAYEIFKRRGYRLFLYFFVMQIALLLKKNGLWQMVNLLRFMLPVRTAERGVGEMLGIKVSAVKIFDVTAALDIDAEPDYYAIKKLIGSEAPGD